MLHSFTTPFSKNTSTGQLLSPPDEVVTGMKVDILVDFESIRKPVSLKKFFHRLNFSDLTNVFFNQLCFQ